MSFYYPVQRWYAQGDTDLSDGYGRPRTNTEKQFRFGTAPAARTNWDTVHYIGSSQRFGVMVGARYYPGCGDGLSSG